MAYSFLGIYKMMSNIKRADGELDPWAYVHRWTLSRHLWEADSSSDFARIWKEKPRFIIKNYAFERFLQHGRGEDVDEFGKIILSQWVFVVSQYP